MTDFAKMAREGREKHEAEQSEKYRLIREQHNAEVTRLATAEQALRAEVLPTLEDAKNAFHSEGIIGVIESNESFSNHTQKKIHVITFKCCKSGEVGTSRAGMAICGTRVRFEHDGTNLFITKDASRERSVSLATITDAVTFALNSYFAAAKK